MRKLLIRLPNWLGDALLARPLLFALRRAFPAAELAGVAPAPLLELLAADATVERLEPWPADRRGRGAVIRRLREWRPDAALVLPPSFSSAWTARRTGARRRVGYRHELRGWLLTDSLTRRPRGDRHLSDEYLDLGARLGATAVPVPRLGVSGAAARAAAALLEERGWSARPLALIAPGALYGPAKRWEGSRYAAVARTLLEEGHAVAVCGTENEAPAAEALARESGAVSLAGRTDLPLLAGLCSRAALAVCNDSGFAHLAAACAARTVVIFGSTSPGWTAPLGSAVRVVQRAPVCAPCFQRSCRIGTVCLRAIEVADVLAACRDRVAAEVPA